MITYRRWTPYTSSDPARAAGPRPPGPRCAPPAGPDDPGRLRCREDAPDNAITRADMPHWRRAARDLSACTDRRVGIRVGLPAGQMGNSEVGHLNIGAGPRRLPGFHAASTWRSRDGQFARNPALLEAVATAQRTAIDAACAGTAVARAACTATSARSRRWSTWPRAGGAAAGACPRFPRRARHAAAGVRARRSYYIAGVCAASRARASQHLRALLTRWTATSAGTASQPAYACSSTARRSTARQRHRAGAGGGLRPRRVRRIREATAIVYGGGHEPVRMEDGDVVVFMNFRADRARADDACADRSRVCRVRARTRSQARALRVPDAAMAMICGLPVRLRPAERSATASANTSRSLGLTQLRIAETEKYAHVTYFFNGGSEARYPGEDRDPGALAQGRHLRPATRNECGRSDRQARRGDRRRPLRRHHLQLRERRHGRAHRQFRRRPKQAIETLDACIGRVVEATRSRRGRSR